MRMRLIGMVMVLAAVVTLTPAAQTNEARVLLEAARKIEMVDGDLTGAIAKYQVIVEQYGKTDRAAAAQALVRIGECHRAMGDTRARAAFEQVIAAYADQTEAVKLAQARLGRPASGGNGSAPGPRLLCEQCGTRFGSIGNDGRFMASINPNTGDLTLYELSTGAATRRHFTGEGGPSGSGLFALLSPDSKQIAYSWNGDDERHDQLRIVPLDARAQPRVLVSNPEFAYVIPAAWMPDGRTLVAFTGKADRTWQLVSVNAADGRVRTLKSLDWRIGVPVHIASVSPNGEYIAYSALADNPKTPARPTVTNRHIYVLASDGSTESVVAGGAAVNDTPIWTPDGANVLYTSNVSGTTDLWAIPISGGKAAGAATLLRKNIGDVLSMGMTAGGLYYFYEGRSGLMRTDIATLGASSPRVTILESVVGSLATWSPDGSSIALLRARAGGKGSDIVVRTLATGAERVYSQPGMSIYPTLWFPDGAGLLLAAANDAGRSWYRLDLATGEFRQLAPERGDPTRLTHQNIKALSPDGRTLYLATYDKEDAVIDRIVALDLLAGVYRDVFSLPLAKASLPSAAQNMAIAISPDGGQLALNLFDGGRQGALVAIVGVNGSGYRELVTGLTGNYIRNKVAWSRDGRWIFFTESRKDTQSNEKHRILKVSVDGGRPEYTGVEVEGLNAFDISPEPLRLAYSTLRPDGSGQLLWALDVAAILRERSRSPRR